MVRMRVGGRRLADRALPDQTAAIGVSRVPILLVTGPVGVGKTTVALEMSRLLGDAGVAHALVDLPWLGVLWPAPEDDPWNERVAHRNLAAVWANAREAGAGRLLLVRVLEARSLLGRIEEAVPGADVGVVRLRAPVEVVRERIRRRESGRDPGWYLGAATALVDSLERSGVEDHVVDNVEGDAAEAAAAGLRLAGWLSA